MDDFQENLWAFWFAIIMFIASLVVIIYFVALGVGVMFKKYWYVWIGVVVFAVTFYYFNPNLTL